MSGIVAARTRAAWDADTWSALSAAGAAQSFAAGAHVLRRGDTGRSLLLVQQGTCAVVDGAAVRRVIGPGEVVGEMALLLGRPRTADVVAVTAVTVTTLEPDDVARLERLAPALMARAYRAVAAQLAERTVVPGMLDGL